MDGKNGIKVYDLETISGIEGDGPIVKISKVIMWRSLNIGAKFTVIVLGQQTEANQDIVILVAAKSDAESESESLMSLPYYVFSSLISRFKIMAACNLAERYTNQEGKFYVRCGDTEYEVIAKFEPTEEIETETGPKFLRFEKLTLEFVPTTAG